MFCPKCGTQLSGDANFCYKCRTPVGQGAKGTYEPKWEYCEITYACKEGFFSGHDFWFWAKAIGPSGTYCAESSSHANYWYGDGEPNSECSMHTQLHDELVRKLVMDGWEPTGERGRYWYQLSFRRRVRVTNGQTDTIVSNESAKPLRTCRRIQTIVTRLAQKHGLNLQTPESYVQLSLARTGDYLFIAVITKCYVAVRKYYASSAYRWEELQFYVHNHGWTPFSRQTSDSPALDYAAVSEDCQVVQVINKSCENRLIEYGEGMARELEEDGWLSFAQKVTEPFDPLERWQSA